MVGPSPPLHVSLPVDEGIPVDVVPVPVPVVSPLVVRVAVVVVTGVGVGEYVEALVLEEARLVDL